MLGFFERQRLVRKGLASSKIRRRRTESEWVETLENGVVAKVAIFVLFLMGLSWLIYSDLRPEPLQKVFIAVLIFLTALAQLWINHPRTFASNSRVLLVFGVCLLHLALIKAVPVTPEDQPLTPDQQYWKLAVPFAFAPLALSVLLSKNHGLYAAIFVSLWGAIVYRAVDPVDPVFIVMSLIVGFTAVFVTLQVRRWTQLLRAGVFIGAATWLLAVIFGRIGPFVWENLGSVQWKTVGWQSAAALGGGLLTAMLAVMAAAVLPSVFRLTTGLGWLELCDLNHPLLRRLSLQASGTYHHSLMVANLAEDAAEAIGANATLCRACAYFHDIGKLVKPAYFTENMKRDRNPHDDLAPTMSALVIIAHVKDGVDLALKAGLNQEIIDIIQQHHGTTLVSYFHKRALQHQEDMRVGNTIVTHMREEDIPEVREETFRYPGPRPQTRECAILSIADSVESASRSLEKATKPKIEQLVDEIIKRRLVDGQLKECDLTMRELEQVAESLKKTLLNMMHTRVSYPDERPEKHDTPRPGSSIQPSPAAAKSA